MTILKRNAWKGHLFQAISLIWARIFCRRQRLTARKWPRFFFYSLLSTRWIYEWTLTNSLERWDVNGILGTKTKVVSKSRYSKVNIPENVNLPNKSSEVNLSSVLPGKAEQFNLTREEYLAICNLQSDRNVITKLADKWSAVVAWDRNDYFIEAEK